MNPINLAKIYSTCMDEIKTRINIILTFNDGKLTTGSDVTKIEFICLQFRKVLELIALASIAPNKEEYSKQSVKFHKDWHAKRILKDLERINPDFYPIPIPSFLPFFSFLGSNLCLTLRAYFSRPCTHGSWPFQRAFWSRLVAY